LQEREVERLGGKKVIPLDVRVLATSNRNLREEVMENRFREDLFYRLCVFPLHLSPLCARKEDIIPIAERLILRWTRGRKPVPVLSEQARDKLLEYAWPGNVRELDNVIQRALILMAGDTIDEENICFETETPDVSHHEPLTDPLPENDSSLLCDDLKSREQRVIVEVLESVKGSRKAAAEKLGISPRTLRYKLARLREMGIEVPA